ncbi:NAD-dependent epimerase/dehydratase family protein [Sporichthya polymorpha]|uniref:NAD-dependent epimerase/dehydratase family protein n=1 Tax=Sporichthya polymorpha TaxID=35751 RepID=UPI00036103BF|nr:NAD-dependent epimerase/dehydratase family protein [Sporichthya polymorpha]
MRVLVTGASGVFGRDVVRRLALHGHEVVGLSRSRPERLPAGMADYRAADIRDADGVRRAVEGMDAVVHLAWNLVPNKDVSITRSIDLGGTRNVVDAMNAHGVKRLVFASSVMSYGCHPDNPPRLSETSPQRPDPESFYSLHKVDAERMIVEAGLDALMVRAGTVIGRSADNIIASNFATPVLPGVKGYTNTMQFVHPEDVGRFFAQAVGERWAGPVNLAAPDTLTMREIASILGRRYVELSRSALEKLVAGLWRAGVGELDPGSFRGLLWFPIVDPARLDELGFRCAWTSRECVEDFARAAAGRTHILGRALPARSPFGYRGHVRPAAPVTESMYPAGPEGLNGEFDSLVDPALPDYSSANTSEAMPGPMTPLALELSLNCMRTAGAAMGDLVQLPHEIAELVADRSTASFGHGVFANMSVIVALSNAMPGASEDAGWESLFGDAKVTAPHFALSVRDKARIGAAAVRAIAAVRRESERVDREVRGVVLDPGALRELTDEQLIARLGLLHDVTIDASTVSSNAAAFVAAVASALEQRGLDVLITGRADDTDLASAAALRAAGRLADEVRADGTLPAAVTAALADGPAAPAVLARTHPAFAERVRAALAEHGHRGPRELELASDVFAVAPHRFLEVIAKLAQHPPRALTPPPAVPAHLRPLAAWCHRLQHDRELGRDAWVRGTHGYRLAALERGRRLMTAGVLDGPDDAFYLTFDQLLAPPADARAVVARRRAERERLKSIRVPTFFSRTWEPEAADESLHAGDTATGIGVSPGVVRGTVRVLDADALEDLEPDEILVAAYTDAGWTPYFGLAAAVITDTGGQMSHAAVVARECGIPCVVSVPAASRRLRTGQTVEVDGSTGRVTVLSDGLEIGARPDGEN